MSSQQSSKLTTHQKIKERVTPLFLEPSRPINKASILVVAVLACLLQRRHYSCRIKTTRKRGIFSLQETRGSGKSTGFRKTWGAWAGWQEARHLLTPGGETCCGAEHRAMVGCRGDYFGGRMGSLTSPCSQSCTISSPQRREAQKPCRWYVI